MAQDTMRRGNLMGGISVSGRSPNNTRHEAEPRRQQGLAFIVALAFENILFHFQKPCIEFSTPFF